MKTKFEEIVDVGKIASKHEAKSIPEIITLAEKENLKPATADVKTTLLLVIDPQNDFMEDIGTLGVPGSRGDIERLTRFIYKEMENITQIMCSKDTHSLAQIFFPCWWIDKDGKNPEPYTIITSEDVKTGVWTPVYSPSKSLEYLKGLEAQGKKKLCIWPYHCLNTTSGAQIESQLVNMIYFHSQVRKSRPSFLLKGQNPLTEMYGIIKSEYDPGNSSILNISVLNAIEKFDVIYVVGEAKTHCVVETLEQILDHFEKRPDVTSKITVFEDCMSSIPGFEIETDQKFLDFEKKYGIKVTTTTEI